jgi:hypothetical protein
MIKRILFALLFTASVHAQNKVWTDVVGEYPAPTTVETILADGMVLEKKHIAVFALKRGDEPEIVDASRVERAADWLQNYWRYLARHKWDVEVRGYNVYTDCQPTPPYYCQNTINDWMSAHDMEGFEPNYFAVWGGYNKGLCGQTSINGTWSVTYNPGTCNELTIAHELGHNFGWHHNGTLNVTTGKDDEYGDNSGIMGGSFHGENGLVSYNIIQEDLDHNFNLIETTQQTILAPIEIDPIGLKANEIQHHMIVASDYPYTLSLRQGLGSPLPTSQRESGIYVHQVRPDGKTKRIEVMYPSDTNYVLPNGITIEYLQYKNERARVNVIMEDGDEIPNKLVLDGGWIMPEGAHITSKHNGAWFNPDFDKQGFDIQIKGDRAVIFWWTYNQRAEDRRWYYGTCLLTKCMEGFSLRATLSGTFANPSIRTDTVIGEAQFYFTNKNSGVFSYRTSEHGIGSIPITAIAFSEDNPINGAWYKPDMNGAGMAFQKYGDLLTGYWFTYGPRGYEWNATNNQTQRWYLLTGKQNTSGSYDMTIFESIGGNWMYPSTVNLEPVGTATVTQVNGQLKFEYGIIADKVTANGTFLLDKIF